MYKVEVENGRKLLNKLANEKLETEKSAESERLEKQRLAKELKLAQSRLGDRDGEIRSLIAVMSLPREIPTFVLIYSSKLML